MEYCNVKLTLKAPENQDPAVSFNGKVTFNPDVGRGETWHDNGVLVPSVRVDAAIANNVLQGADGKKLVKLMAGGAGVNPEQVYWRIAFDDIYLGEQRVHIDPFVFEAVPGATLDLEKVTPVAGYTPPGIIKGDKGEPGFSFKGVFNKESELPSSSKKGDAWANLSSKDLYIWNGSKWEVVTDFGKVDVGLENIAEYVNQAERHASNTKVYEANSLSYAQRAEFAAEETIQQVEGDFATRNYVDSKAWIKRGLNSGEDLNNLREPGVYATNTGSVMSSLANRPLGFTGPGHVRVTTSGQTIFQEVTQHTTRGTETTKRQTTGGVFGEWESTEAKTRTLHYNDYNDVPEGYFDIGTFSKGRDMANRPSDIPASSLVISKRIGTGRMYQLIIGTDVYGVASKWERRKSSAGEWSEWSRVHTDVSRSEVEQMISANSGIVVDDNKVVTVGDSQVGASYAWANLLSGISGQTVLNMGVSGYTPDEALMKSGVRNMVTTTAVTLPSRVDVPVTVVEPPVVAKNRSRVWVGTIDGKTVEFKYSDDLKTFALRNQGSATIEVPSGSVWVSNEQGAHPDHRRIVWFGGNSIRNGMSQPWETPAEHVMRAYSDAISEWGDTTVVCGYVPAYGDKVGRDVANELNSWLHRVVPTQFLDMRYRLQLAAPDILGRELTLSEQQDIVNGYLPRPLYRSDLVHLVDEAHVRIAEIVAEFPHGASPQISIRSKPSPVVTLTGEGFPEGVVTAPVGSTYTDTAATNGAIRWVKTIGTGNTGWRVEYGDTGWRDVTSLLTNGWTAQRVLLRRHGSTVTLSTLGLSSDGATSGLLISLPSTFHNATTYITMVTPNDTRIAFWNRSSGLTMVNYESIHFNTYAGAKTNWEIVPDTPWPASLPGTPA